MVTVDELKKTAALAGLSLDNVDIDALLSDLGDVIEFASMIAKAQIPADAEDRRTDVSRMRDDTVIPSYDRSLLLLNANESDGGSFIVKKRRRADDDH